VVLDIIIIVYAWWSFYLCVNGGFLYGCRQQFSNLWNCLDVLIWALINVIVFLRVVYDRLLSLSFDLRVPHFVTLSAYSVIEYSIYNMTAVLLFFSVVLFLRFLQENRRVSKIFQTLHIASGYLAAYFFIFFFIMVGFVGIAFICFGPYVDEFRTPLGALSQTLKMLMGNVPYRTLVNAHPWAGPVFFAMFTWVVTMVLMNIFFAIIIDAYQLADSQISEEAQSDGFWVNLTFGSFKTILLAFKARSGANVGPQAKSG
jgi:hypothetical protein